MKRFLLLKPSLTTHFGSLTVLMAKIEWQQFSVDYLHIYSSVPFTFMCILNELNCIAETGFKINVSLKAISNFLNRLRLSLYLNCILYHFFLGEQFWWWQNKKRKLKITGNFYGPLFCMKHMPYLLFKILNRRLLMHGAKFLMCDAICNVHFLVWSEYLLDLDIFCLINDLNFCLTFYHWCS